MNKARGEVELTLGGQTFTACATLGAMARVEGIMNKTLPELLRQDVARGSYAGCLVLLQECLMDPDRKGELADLVASPVELAEACMGIVRAAGLLSEGGNKGNGK